MVAALRGLALKCIQRTGHLLKEITAGSVPEGSPRRSFQTMKNFPRPVILRDFETQTPEPQDLKCKLLEI